MHVIAAANCLVLDMIMILPIRMFIYLAVNLILILLYTRLGEKSLSYLMKISIESPQKFNDEDLETMIKIWNRASVDALPSKNQALCEFCTHINQ